MPASPPKNATKAQLQEVAWAQHETIQLLEERFAELELAIEDQGWIRLSNELNHEFSREGLRKIMAMATMAYLKNPLIRSATNIISNYVFGQGCTVHAPDDAINKVVQKHLKNRHNKKVLWGEQARLEKDIELQTKANLFLVLFSDSGSGDVQIRSIPAEEIEDVIRNPNDSADCWYYKRRYTRLEFDPSTGKIEMKENVVEYYPDWQYNPDTQPASFGGDTVKWDSPVYHVYTGRLGDMRFGIPEHYASLDWAMAVKNDLEDYATIRRALARFAFKLTVGTGPNAVSKAKTKLGSTIGTSNPVDRNPPPTPGSTWIQPPGTNLDPIKTAGMQPSPDEGRRLWLMVGAGSGIPETMLSGDTSSGNFASARTLDRPTELKMKTRQDLWANVYRDILGYVVRKSQGSISGELTSLPATIEAAIREATAIVNLAPAQVPARISDDTDEVEINVDFPDVLEHDVLPMVQAITQAATLNGQKTAGTMSDRTLIRLLLGALKVDNADALIDEILPGGAEYFDTEDDESEETVDPITGQPIEKPKPDPETQKVRMTDDGLHKVAPPPPSMRNQESGPSPFENQPGPEGIFQSDKDSQRVKGTTPPRGSR